MDWVKIKNKLAKFGDSYFQIWNYESFTDWPTHPLTGEGASKRQVAAAGL